jgi:predicted transposase/invertase (TIGR01784 family)
VSPKLRGEEALWPGSLRTDLNAADMEKLLRASIERTVYKRRPAFLNVILAANPNILQEVREMIMTKGLREALVDLGLAAEWERQGVEQGFEQGIERGITRGKIEDAFAMINEGLSIEFAAKVIGISAERLESLLLSGSGEEE